MISIEVRMSAGLRRETLRTYEQTATMYTSVNCRRSAFLDFRGLTMTALLAVFDIETTGLFPDDMTESLKSLSFA
jgi:hypothetical protein